MSNPIHAGAHATGYLPLQGRRVFMVEEDDRLYCALKDTLQDAGCETFGLFTAVSETLNAVPESHFDVALIDVSRHDPRFSSVIDRLNDRGIPILLITARAVDDLPALLRSRRRIAKPFTEQDLLDGIAEVIGERASA